MSTTSVPTTSKQAPAPASVCAHCGAPLESLDRFCQECGRPQPVEAEAVDPPRQKHLRCESCGAQIAIDVDRRSYTCAFCDSTYVVEFDPDLTGRQPPEFVIGFVVTPDEALKKFRAWLAENSWFRPGDLHRAKIEEKLRGVYLPFWSFSLLARSRWSTSIGEYWYRTETYTTTVNGKTVTKTRRVRETEWWDLAGDHHQYYSGYLVSASRGLEQQEAERIAPFQLPALKRYAPGYLAGWMSEEYSLERDAAMQVCQAEYAQREQQAVAAFLPGDAYSGLAVETESHHQQSDLILLPIYLLSYRYEDTLYRFLLNGQTGKAAGDKPTSRRRIAAALAVVLGLGALLVLWLVLMNR